MVDEVTWGEALKWASRSSVLFIKKLARNDCAWADDAANGHQNGVYIPGEIRESGFFPALTNSKPASPHIFDARFHVYWPAANECTLSSLKHYSNKGKEAHFTRVPKGEFAGLTPASWLLGGRLINAHGEAALWFMTIDAASDVAELLESVLDLDSTFHFGLIEPLRLTQAQDADADVLIEEIRNALASGTLAALVAKMSDLPTANSLAAESQRAFLQQGGYARLDPYEIQSPGDAIMRISRDIEYALYKRAERKRRAVEVVHALSAYPEGDLVAAVVRGFGALNTVFLSASQQRKSRAGTSFERHVATMLDHGNIKHEQQAILGRRRPDFVLPSVAALKGIAPLPFPGAMVLALKTTLRERWKQTPMEKVNGTLFLATVDDRVTAAAIDDMRVNDIRLVVPESLKRSTETCYPRSENVISFRDFFDDEVARRRPFLLVR